MFTMSAKVAGHIFYKSLKLEWDLSFLFEGLWHLIKGKHKRAKLMVFAIVYLPPVKQSK